MVAASRVVFGGVGEMSDGGWLAVVVMFVLGLVFAEVELNKWRDMQRELRKEQCECK